MAVSIAESEPLDPVVARLSVEERFLQLMELQRFASELRHAGRRPGAQ